MIRVLIADDQELIRQSLSFVLDAQADIEMVGTASNGREAIEQVRKEKPDVVICTGVLAMIPICLMAKIAGRKLIYIESFAKVTSPTMTGKLLYRFADQFYVQWPQMLDIYPEAIYLGGIY